MVGPGAWRRSRAAAACRALSHRTDLSCACIKKTSMAGSCPGHALAVCCFDALIGIAHAVACQSGGWAGRDSSSRWKARRGPLGSGAGGTGLGPCPVFVALSLPRSGLRAHRLGAWRGLGADVGAGAGRGPGAWRGARRRRPRGLGGLGRLRGLWRLGVLALGRGGRRGRLLGLRAGGGLGGGRRRRLG